MNQTPQFVYVGTYTRIQPEPRGRGEGIYVYRFEQESGGLEFATLLEDVPNPSFLAANHDGTALYAANETTDLDGHPGGAVSAFAVDRASGELTFLNRQPSHGTDPCHVRVDRSGRVVMAANYSSGSVAILPIQFGGGLAAASDVKQHRGSGPDPTRQEGPHTHFITPDPTSRYALAADLGLDQVLIYEMDAERGTLTPHVPSSVSLPPRSGPRHLAFHPSARFVYVINELASTMSVCGWDAEAGSLQVLQTISTLPEGFEGTNSCAEVRVAPSGRFVYGSNRGHDSIAIFAVDPDNGTLSFAGHVATQGRNPRNFTIDPNGMFLLAANQDSDTIVTFRIDPETGGLTATGQVTTVPSPVCVTFLPG